MTRNILITIASNTSTIRVLMNSSKLNQTKHVKERKPLSQSQSTTHKYIIFCHQMFCSRFPAMPTSYTFLTSCYPQIRKRAIEKERVRGHGTHEKRERIEQNRMTASTAYTYRLERLIEYNVTFNANLVCTHATLEEVCDFKGFWNPN